MVFPVGLHYSIIMMNPNLGRIVFAPNKKLLSNSKHTDLVFGTIKAKRNVYAPYSTAGLGTPLMHIYYCTLRNCFVRR